MAKASTIAIAEVEEIVELGALNPDEIHLPGVYVDRVIQGEKYEKKIEVTRTIKKKQLCSHLNLKFSLQKVTIQKTEKARDSAVNKSPVAATRERIIRRLALEFRDGMYGILQFLFKLAPVY